MSFSPCPKPQPTAPKPRKWLPRATKPIARAWLKRGTKKIPPMNVQATKRRAVKYGAVIRSDFNKRLRYLAYSRSMGLCECDDCRFDRSVPNGPLHAWEPIPCWFVRGGAAAHKRFRSTEGELHHVNYKYFGDENLAELDVVRWTWKSCHRRIEAEHSTRRRFLKGVK